jgi:hypothetical protein
MSTGTQMQTVWAPWIRDLAEMLETQMLEVRHKRELKHQHPEPLDPGRILHAPIHWKNKLAPTSPPSARALAYRTTRLPPCRLTILLLTGLPCFCPTKQPGHCLLAHQASAPRNCQASAPWHCQTSACPLTQQSATRGLQHHQIQVPNLPRRCRQAGLDAKGVTPKLLRLKFYCSWIRNFFSLYFFFSFTCLSCSLSDCPPYLLVDFFGSPFLFLFFLPSFLFFSVLLLYLT